MKSKTPDNQRRLPLHQRVADILRTRILHGDYSLKPIPSERKLATEFQVNYMTVRQSLRSLEAEGLLSRERNGRLGVKSRTEGGKRHFNFVMLMPAGHNLTINLWLNELGIAAKDFPMTIRAVLYSHWQDPALLDSLSTFDAIFLYPYEQEPPGEIIKRLKAAQNPLVVLDHDYSPHGIPSIQLFPAIFVNTLLDHLRADGHTCVGCFNIQTTNAETTARIEQWRFWKAINGFEGRLIDEPVAFYGSTSHHAHKVAVNLLSKSRGRETAWLCITRGAAMGMVRAMADLKIRPGPDLAVCVINGEGIAELLVPSVTALEPPDMQGFLRYALRMMTSSEKWSGSLLIQPHEANLVVRESTQRG